MLTVLVIGGSRGIGEEFVRQEIANGNKVYYTVRDKSNYSNSTNGGIVCEVDVSNINSFSNLLNDFLENNIMFDIIYHSAGILPDRDYGSDSHNTKYSAILPKTVEEMEKFENLIRYSMDINTFGVLRSFCLLGRSVLKKCGTFAILSTKLASISDNESGGLYSYRMSKTALNMCVKNLIHEGFVQDKEIKIALLHPGHVKTDMSRYQGPIEKEESVEKMIQITKNWTVQENGTFIHAITGNKIDW